MVSQELNTNQPQKTVIEVELGLDASTTTVGICVIRKDTGELLSLSYLDLSSKVKYDDIYDKIVAARNHLDNLLSTNSNWTLTKIHIEEYIKQFTPGFSSADTLFTLAIFNHSICQFFFDKYNLKPNKVNVRSARKYLDITIDYKDKSKTTKQKVFDKVKDENPNFPWFTYIAKAGKQKGNQVFGKQNEDMADAWVVAYGGWISSSAARITSRQIAKGNVYVRDLNSKSKRLQKLVLPTKPSATTETI